MEKKKKKETFYIDADFETFIQSFIDNKIDCIIKYTDSTLLVETELNKYCVAETKNSFSFFAILRKLKKQIEKNVEVIENYNPKPVYFKYADEIVNEKQIANIDLNSAYLQTLFNLKWIDESLFIQINALDKVDRLKIVGMLASEKICYKLEKGVMKFQEIISNDLGRYVFFYVSEVVGKCLIDCKNEIESDFLFFWVDGIYFKDTKENREKICNVMDMYNYRYKIEICSDLIITENKLMTFINEKGQQKKYTLPRSINGKKKISKLIKKQWQKI